jgi:hypothetical protein
MTDEPKPVSKWMTLPKRRKEETEVQRIGRTGDTLTPYERQMVRMSVRIDIPLRDAIDLRRIAQWLMRLGRELDMLSRSRGKEFSILLEAQQKIRLTNHAVKSKDAVGDTS